MAQVQEEAVRAGAEEGRRRRQETLWVNYAAMAVGAWLIASPFTLGYLDIDPAIAWSDIAVGALAVLFGAFSVAERHGWARWGNAILGMWLLFAPLVFETPSAAAYTSNTLSGILLIAFAFVIPGMPGQLEPPGPAVPPGWTYNPSSWFQRAPPIVLALICFFIARYMSAFQLGHIDQVWDPFFGLGSEEVLTSDVSEAFPISDTGLGSIAYILEALAAFVGTRNRWRTTPSMVLLFFLLVVPLGTVSITLVIMQPVLVGAWCTLCLVTALLMLLMIPFALDEMVATGQFLAQSRREGSPFWRTFWRGGTLAEGGAGDERTPSLGAPVRGMAAAAAWGITVPWTLVVAALLGLWTLGAPDFLRSAGLAADSTHLTGALITTAAVIAMAEPVRAFRYAIIPLGLWLIVTPFIFDGATFQLQFSNVLAGLAAIAAAIPRGPIRETFGTWDRLIR